MTLSFTPRLNRRCHSLAFMCDLDGALVVSFPTTKSLFHFAISSRGLAYWFKKHRPETVKGLQMGESADGADFLKTERIQFAFALNGHPYGLDRAVRLGSFLLKKPKDLCKYL